METNIKKFIVSRFGTDGILCEVDWVQLEICALAEITTDPVLIEELNSGVDIHKRNASMWLKKPEHEVTKEERRLAKVMTFQLQYGASPKKMAESLGVSVSNATSFVTDFYIKYKLIDSFHTNLMCMKREHEKNNTIPTPLQLTNHITGRDLTFAPKLNKDPKPNPRGRLFGTWYISSTELKNYFPQSLATGDMVPIVGNMLFDHVVSSPDLNRNIKFINTVHDSYVYDVHCSTLLAFFSVVEAAFVSFPSKMKELFDYDLKVNYNYTIKIGSNLFDLHELSRRDVQQEIIGV